MLSQKIPRLQNRDLIDYIKENAPCICCGRYKTEDFEIFAHHVWHQGAGGPDEVWNLMPLCVKHHSEIHYGLEAMSKRHPTVRIWLTKAGWTFENKKWRWPDESTNP